MKNNIKKIRTDKGITQCELSEKSGISRPYISDLENSESETVKARTMQKIADALEEDVSSVFLIDK